MDVIEERIQYCLVRNQGLIAWDWDGTLSANGVELLERCKPIIEYFREHYNWYSIIVTSRHQPIPVDDDKLRVIGFPVMVIYNEHNANSYRFKFYVLRELFSKGKGVLRLYIDNQSELLEAFNLNAPEIPVSDVCNFDSLRLVEKIRVQKELMARRLRGEKNQNS